MIIDKKLNLRCPHCGSKQDISAFETIEATTELRFKDGAFVDSNNEYGDGIRIEFKCWKCEHRWMGRKGVTILSYLKD